MYSYSFLWERKMCNSKFKYKSEFLFEVKGFDVG